MRREDGAREIGGRGRENKKREGGMNTEQREQKEGERVDREKAIRREGVEEGYKRQVGKRREEGSG